MPGNPRSLCFPVRKQCLDALANLSDESATGPGLVPARTFKSCAEQLAEPPQILLLRLLETVSWPESQRCALHCTFVEGCRTPVAFEPNQFAHTKGRGARDALACPICLGFLRSTDARKLLSTGSDVAGAFDRVRAERLLEKLRCTGVQPAFVDLAGSWLQQRSAQVVVEGQRSDKMLFRNVHCSWTHTLEPFARGYPRGRFRGNRPC